MSDSPSLARTRRRREEQEDDRDLYVPPFELRGNRSLRRLGLKKRWVSVALGEGMVVAATGEDAVLEVPFEDIESVLLGRETLRAVNTYWLELTTRRHGRIVFYVRNRDAGFVLFAHLVRGIAVALQRRGALDSFRLGLPRVYAFAAAPVVAGSLLGVTLMATDAATRRATPAQDWLLGILVLFVLLVVVTGQTVRQGFHRPLRNLDPLDRLLGFT